MKTVIINASPRKNWNTAQLLKEALKGAESVGAETEYVDLYDLNFSGCRSCLACKRKGMGELCRCYWKDGLSPVLDKILEADHLIIGSPVYFSEPTGGLRSFMERLIFPALSYNDYSSRFHGKINVDVFLTMNMPANLYGQMYEKRMQEYFAPFGFLNGSLRIFPVCDTLQVEDYSKYDMAAFSEEHKRFVKETEFRQALEKAFEVGSSKEQVGEWLSSIGLAE